MDYSKKTCAKAREYKLKPEAMAFADLVSMGWDSEDAYKLAFRAGMTWTKRALNDEIDKLMENEGIKLRISGNRQTVSDTERERIENGDVRKEMLEKATSKEEMLLDLQSALDGMKKGSQEWRDTKKMIIDVSRMKQDEVKTGDSTIHYYLPVNYPTSCEKCLVFAKKCKNDAQT